MEKAAEFESSESQTDSKEETPDLAHERVARQAARTPNALAVRSERRQLTFEELDRRTNRLARYIQKLGVATETPVGLYFERSVEFVVAALAVLKSAAWAPMFPWMPPILPAGSTRF